MAVIRLVRKKDKLRKKLAELVPSVNGAINQANQTSATELAEAIRNRAPVATGEYRDSINAHPVDDVAGRSDQSIGTTFRHTIRKGKNKGKRVSRAARAVDTLAWGVFALYIWRYIEFGTSKTPAQPHIMGTYRSLRRRFKSRNSRAINKAIKKVAGK